MTEPAEQPVVGEPVARQRGVQSRRVIVTACAVVVVVMVGCSRWSTPSPVDCVIVAGQSNAVGFDADPALLPADPIDASVLFWWRVGDPPPDGHDSIGAGVLQAQPRGTPQAGGGDRQSGNFRSPAGGFGPEVSFARLLAHREGKPLAIVKAAWNGTGLREDWSPKGEGGPCYRSLLSTVQLAREDARARGVELRLRALLWLQGESDANVQDIPHYAESLKRMFAAMRRDLGAGDLPVFVGVNVHYGDVSRVRAKMADIIRAQKAVSAADQHTVYVDTDGASLANEAHFNAAGTLELGRRYAESLLSYEASRKPTRE